MDFSDVAKKTKDLLNNGVVKTGITLVTTGIEMVCPPSALLIEPIKQIGSDADEYKVDAMLKGLQRGESQEETIRKLYEFVDDPEKAFLVSNAFRQSLLSHSRLVSCIMGLIVSEQWCGTNDYIHENLIIMNALQTATDYEILYLNDIFKNYLDGEYIDVEKIGAVGLFGKYNLVIDWGINNRVLEKFHFRSADGFDQFGEFPGINMCSKILRNYIDIALQLLCGI